MKPATISPTIGMIWPTTFCFKQSINSLWTKETTESKFILHITVKSREAKRNKPLFSASISQPARNFSIFFQKEKTFKRAYYIVVFFIARGETFRWSETIETRSNQGNGWKDTDTVWARSRIGNLISNKTKGACKEIKRFDFYFSLNVKGRWF